MSRNTQWKRRKAAEMTLKGASNDAIIKAIGIRESTLMRWQRHPEFIDALAEVGDQMEAQLQSRLYMLALKSADLLSHCASESNTLTLYEQARHYLNFLKKNDLLPDADAQADEKPAENAPITSQNAQQTDLNAQTISQLAQQIGFL